MADRHGPRNTGSSPRHADVSRALVRAVEALELVVDALKATIAMMEAADGSFGRDAPCATKARPRKRKGSPVTDRIIDNMQNAIERNETTVDGLAAMRDEDAANKFGTREMPANGWKTKNGSHPQRTVVVKARDLLLSRLQSRQITKNDK